MTVQIFAMTHKKFQEPNDSLYLPLHVGHIHAQDLGYTGDDTGDHISFKNCYYSELTGLYWIWKNYHESDYVGVCHYRRYLLNYDGKVFTAAECEQLLSEYDILTTKKIQLNFSYYYGFSKNHNIFDLDMTGTVLKELFPDYYNTFLRLVHKKETYFGNIMICSRKLFDSYCSFLFPLFAEVEKRIHVDTYDDYHKRIFGFISEFLLYVYIEVNHLRVKECVVGMIGEKAETSELKKNLALYFSKQDFLGAKDYFLSVLNKRPDVLMEASDINGHLRLCMQIIATCEAEFQANHTTILNTLSSLSELLSHFGRLNLAVSRKLQKSETTEDTAFLSSSMISSEAISIAQTVVAAGGADFLASSRS